MRALMAEFASRLGRSELWWCDEDIRLVGLARLGIGGYFAAVTPPMPHIGFAGVYVRGAPLA